MEIPLKSFFAQDVHQGRDFNQRLPYNIDLEKSILSAFLLDSSLFNKFIGGIDPEDFYLPLHRDIFFCMLSLFSSSQHIDIIFLQEALLKKGFDGEMIKRYISDLSENIFAMGLVDSYLPLLKEKSNLRKIISSANMIISQCYDGRGLAATEIVDNAERLFFAITAQQKRSYYSDLDSSIKSVFSHIASTQHSVSGVTGVSTGFKELDLLTSGLQKGDLIILAARPSMGKTAFALCLARNAALYGAAVAFVSLEMGSDQLVMRILSFESRVPLASLRSGGISSQEWELLTLSAARVSDYPIFIDDAPAQTIFDIKTRARQICLERNINLLIIDYLQLLNTGKKFESRHYEVSEISRSLKSIAKELMIPVLALSQLSRNVESRTDKRPLLSDLRDSGAIEQDADLILFLYRDVVYNKDTVFPDSVELIIGKQRNGPTGVVSLRYVREYTSFEDFSYELS